MDSLNKRTQHQETIRRQMFEENPFEKKNEGRQIDWQFLLVFIKINENDLRHTEKIYEDVRDEIAS